ncbi:MAG TPA: outer membrane protein transport protein [Thermodesulfobacteriota bacterium]|nr:outer membrane protein transport protein [Thermodesulfobacteriota bacterium]HQO78894.1 outer membrane protein transport protein [Thermodesulfobacteriota bacterium]
MEKAAVVIGILCSLALSPPIQSSQALPFQSDRYYLSESFKSPPPETGDGVSSDASKREPADIEGPLPSAKSDLSGIGQGSSLTGPISNSTLWVHSLFGIDYYEDSPLTLLSEPDQPLIFAVRPSIAYQVSSWIVPGGELTAFDDRIEVPPPSSSAIKVYPDEKIFTQRRSAAGILGLLLRPQSGWRLAVTYREKGSVSGDQAIELLGEKSTIWAALGPSGFREGAISAEDDLPQALLVSGYNRINDRFALLASFGWLNWSKIERSEALPGSTSSLNSQESYLSDVWHLGLGARYQVSRPWIITAGLGIDKFDNFSTDESDDGFGSLAGEQLRYATAVRYGPVTTFSVGAGYLYLEGANLIPNGFSSTLWGSDDEVHLFSIDFDWRF